MRRNRYCGSLQRMPVRWICLLALSAFAGAQGAETVKAESRIVRVTVMADRAEVTRKVTAKVPKGESIVAVEGLPVELDERTVWAESPQGATVQGLSCDLVSRKEAPAGDRAELRKRLSDAKGRVEVIDATVLGLRRKVELARSYRRRTMEAIGVQATLPKEKLPGGKLDLASWESALTALSTQELGAQERLRRLEVERYGLQQEISDLTAQIKAFDAPRVVEVRRALAGISSAAGGDISFLLVYRIAGPTWRVRYDFRYQSAQKKLQIEAYGMVLQKTGEDWRNVELMLSNRLPSGGLRPPEATALVLEGQQTAKMQQELASYSESQSTLSVPTTAAAAAKAAAPAPQPGVVGPRPIPAPVKGAWKAAKGLEAFVAMETSLTGHVFKVMGRSTVLSDSEPQQVPILKATADASLALEAVPSQSSAVYRRVNAVNTSGAPLLPGNAVLFLDGNLVGSTVVPSVGPGADLALSFGAVNGLSVVTSSETGQAEAREEVIDAATRTRTYRFANRYEVSNLTGKKVSLRVLDTVPVSEAKDVEVRIEKKRSSPFAALGKGILAFKVDAEPKKPAVVRLFYSISLPAELGL